MTSRTSYGYTGRIAATCKCFSGKLAALIGIEYSGVGWDTPVIACSEQPAQRKSFQKPKTGNQHQRGICHANKKPAVAGFLLAVALYVLLAGKQLHQHP